MVSLLLGKSRSPKQRIPGILLFSNTLSHKYNLKSSLLMCDETVVMHRALDFLGRQGLLLGRMN